jgi:hypothetical protein
MPSVPTTTPLYKTSTPQYEECSRFFSGTFPQLTAPSPFLQSSHNCWFSHILVPLTILLTAHIFRHNDDDWSRQFLPAVVMMPHILCHVNLLRQYNSTHYNSNAQHGAWYNSTRRTTLPMSGKSQRTHLSTINVHNNRPIDSAHFVQPMSDESTRAYWSPSLVHICNDSLADSIHIVSYIGRQCIRTVPNVDIVGSSKCHARHLATGGVARFNYILVTSLHPVMTCTSDRWVNQYPNMVARLETSSLANSKWDYSPCLNCSNPSFLLQGFTITNTTAAYCMENIILLTSNAHFFGKLTWHSHLTIFAFSLLPFFTTAQLPTSIMNLPKWVAPIHFTRPPTTLTTMPRTSFKTISPTGFRNSTPDKDIQDTQICLGLSLWLCQWFT